MDTQLLEVLPSADAVMVGFNVKRPVPGGFARERTVYQVLRIRDRRVIDVRGYVWESGGSGGAGWNRRRA